MTDIPATTPSAASPAVTVLNRRTWLFALLAGAVAVVVHQVALLGGTLDAATFLAAEIVAIVVTFAAIRFNRPARSRAWVLIGLGLTMVMFGDVAWYALVEIQHSPPTPSFADLLYLAEYPFLVAGIVLLVRTRLDRAVVLDTLIATAGAGVVVWELLIRPYLDRAHGDSIQIGIAVAYPLADLALLAVLARLSVGRHRWSPTLRLLAAGLVTLFVADVANLRIGLVEPNPDRSVLDGVWLVSVFLLAAAALHPSARMQPSEDDGDWAPVRSVRFPLLLGALLLTPATLVLATAFNGSIDLPAFTAVWAILAALVALRVEGAITLARQSEDRFRIIFEGSPAGTAIARRGRVILINRRVRSMVGLADEVNVRSALLTDYIAAEQRADLVKRVEARLIGRVEGEAFETVGLRVDGSKFPLVAQTRDIDLPDGRATIGFLMDVSAERAADETLRASEHRYRELFEGNPHPMWIHDAETFRILAVNDTAIRQYGWSRDDFTAMTVDDLRPREDRESRAVLLPNDRDPLLVTTTRHLRADGSIIWVELTSHEGAWDGRPARVVLAADVTERRKLEDQLRQAQKMEAVGRLAGGVAHDFNNLLTAISGYAEIVRSDFEPGDDRIANVDEILLASGRAAALTRQLLAFSRRQVLQPRILDLNESIEEIRGMLVRLIGEDIELRVELGPNLGLVRADPGQLTQVLMNLAVNARDAMPNGGTLALQTEGVVLDDAFARAHEGVRPGPHVMLTVSDTGAGMDGSTLGHLYEPFFTTKDPGKGTGLGLATVYGIVRQSEGSIDVQSEVGRGSSFRICLPLVQVDDSMVDVEGAGSGSRGGHETVLVVEDEEAVRRLAISVLERQGYAVLSAEGPMSAEAILVEHAGTIDLLLTDVIMPGGNGAELAARATTLRPNLTVLMMSGYAQDALLERSAADLAASLIEKPFTPDVLLARVRVALDARSAGAAGR